MEKRSGFFSKFFKALNPFNYDKLVETPLVDTFLYLPKLLLFTFILMLFVLIPVLFGLPNAIDQKISKTSAFSIDFDFSQDTPIRFPIENTQIVIDKNANASAIGASKILITNNSIVYKPLPCQLIPLTCPIYDYGNKRFEKDMTGYSNVLSHKDFYIDTFTLLVILLLPSFLAILYVVYLVKFLFVALFFALLSFAVFRTARYEISLKDTIKIAIYSLTLMVAIEIVLIPLNIMLYYLHFALFLLYLCLGILRTGYRDRRPKRKGPKREGYLDLKEMREL